MADAVEKPRRSSPYGSRVLLANLVVVLGFAGVLVFFAFLVSRNSSDRPWSAYKPKGGDVYQRAQKLVDHVSTQYRYQGAPIAIVQAQPLIYRSSVVDGVALLKPPLRQVGIPQYPDFEPAGSIMTFVFCGQAAKCSLPQASAPEVGPLLQRESLELALYTFKYWPDVRSIVSLLPAAQGQNAAVFLRRRNVQEFLDRPLQATLPFHRELSAESMTEAELATINRVVVKNTYASRFEQVPNGGTLLLLNVGNG